MTDSQFAIDGWETHDRLITVFDFGWQRIENDPRVGRKLDRPIFVDRHAALDQRPSNQSTVAIGDKPMRGDSASTVTATTAWAPTEGHR
ncbi:hypothetical protein [Rosistilla oblonga]|uniref:hypothetical protein n=1 Tax=Rosistilla oblonga TaxID=2527990 RepID=UPI003A96D117